MKALKAHSRRVVVLNELLFVVRASPHARTRRLSVTVENAAVADRKMTAAVARVLEVWLNARR